MKAIRIDSPRHIGICEIQMPIRMDGHAIIKVKSVGVCGTDVATYRGINPNVTYPVIIGHETAGEIYDIDPDNESGLKKGDRVILDPYMYCAHCYPCSKGRTNCCETLKCLGVQTDGSMSEFFAHPIKQLVRMPEKMSWELAPISEPLTIALHAIHTVDLQSGEHYVINGAGPIGLLAAMAAKVYGGTPVILDIDDSRLSLARECGVEYAINILKEDPVEKLKDITHGRMAECVMEASGAAKAVASCLSFAASTGRIALTGWPKDKVLMDTALITRKELQVRGSRNSVGEFPEAIELIASNKVDVRKILSREVPFNELPLSIKNIDEHPGDFVKVVGLL
ncbi:alcohol dehydrogenase catalytic domain-containing protein [Treponema parvum]|uniref:Alcohol dehydrogenase catalytic domain-containing protein n=1 Tax=Treponema parvum TaxID=138851 RepID=A0A975EZ40_9SPIR|nr:alcohol dehydrogenase catalytic domain-containing protein [Treponema parvum]QTQ11591.1 alcohol dehydrogenase catalytic domain-containing protein [Treponema parvum]